MPSTTSPITSLPPNSALQNLLNTQTPTTLETTHPAYLHHLATTILQNLQLQHDWTSLKIHTHSPLTSRSLPRPLISGLPPRRAYIHPDEQVAILKAEHSSGETIAQFPEREWVLPTHLEEKWSLARFAEVFDAVGTVPPGSGAEGREDAEEDGKEIVGGKWQGENRQKRILLATVHDDSTIVYYIMHDGIVKPRQN
ncbi:uncharacterized protein EAF01_007361 [Botrytis porri]|uniref:tRNA-splicing endonuclease subunit Sen15 domain-containing protein n=1 Tax=Botrytis porri TaxID=87229 RepID=A0A4Z1L6V0_9HELO|nr:uncharacterized protein EAF01_007361 [Botrytis porri]KAF7902063.1 hypothetical protein EAF01_007361 [Botrytis porri]TGO92396.1 hypothetical protein BPOR_0004g00410 [Botrytis porri]